MGQFLIRFFMRKSVSPAFSARGVWYQRSRDHGASRGSYSCSCFQAPQPLLRRKSLLPVRCLQSVTDISRVLLPLRLVTSFLIMRPQVGLRESYGRRTSRPVLEGLLPEPLSNIHRPIQVSVIDQSAAMTFENRLN